MPAIAPKPRTVPIPIHLQKCLDALDQKKAENLRLLHVGNVSSITEYFLIAKGTSNPHLKSLNQAVIDYLAAQGVEVAVAGVGDQSGWAVVDAYDFMVHIFTAEVRAYFNLEGLWKDGQPVEW